MQQYVIIARDGDDAEALERRLQARPGHLAGAAGLKEKGNFVVGGAILNEEGQMCGSVMIVQFDSEEDFRHWYDNEPYILQGVWKDIEVKPFRVANV